MNWAAILWLVLMVLFIMIEASTVTMFCLWFAGGALVSMILSLLNIPLWIQVTVFFVVSGVLLALFRPLVKRFLTPKITRTNVESVVGTVGIVKEDIDNLSAKGRVKLGALEWSARSTTGEPIPAGTQIKADSVEGVKVYVSAVK